MLGGGWKSANALAVSGVLGVLMACSSGGPGSEATGVARQSESAGAPPRPVLTAPPPGGRPPRPLATPSLAYNGGQVISQVKVYEVTWGSPVVAWTGALPGLYGTITNSPYMDWLGQYSTPTTGGTGQTIVRGSFGGAYTITPSNTSTALSQTDIGVELQNQITAGNLPKPEVDAQNYVTSLYMFDFPNGYTITLNWGSKPGTSCKDFCGFHFDAVITVSVGGQNVNYDVPYGVMPYCAGGCDMGDTHSHEMIEAITDPSTNASGWLDPNTGNEVADECETLPPTPFMGYDVSEGWSNANGACIAEWPICKALPATPSCRLCTAADDKSNPLGCYGSTPVCATSSSDPKAGTCVACVDDTTCTGKCDTSTDTCAACTGNSDCTSPRAVCSSGACVQCTAGDVSACTGSTPYCDAVTNKCVGCAVDTDCPAATPICDPGTKTCRACAGNSDCKTGVCATGTSDPLKGQCVQCQASTDCAAPAICDTKNDTCVGCTDGTMCSNPAPVCGSNQQCRGCQATSECPKGQTCATSGSLAGSCVGCASSASCSGVTPVCDGNAGACMGCTGDNASGTTYACPDPAHPACQPASASASLAGSCTQCSASNDKACNGHGCDTTTGTCKSGSGGGGGGCSIASGAAGSSGLPTGGAVGAIVAAALALAGRRRRARV